MPLTIGSTLRAETQKSQPAEPFLFLFDIVADETVSATTRFRLVNQPQQIVYDGKTFYPFPIAFSQLDTLTDGSLPTAELTLSNVSRELPRYLEVGAGFVGNTVTVVEVSKASLSPAQAVTRTYTITAASMDADAVTFTLETEDPHKTRAASMDYSRTRCRHRYGDDGCRFVLHSGLPANLQTCNKSIADCVERGQYEVDNGRARMHPRQYGSFPMILRSVVQ